MKFIAMTIALFSFSSFAFSREIKITSFNFTGSRNRTAELCGKVIGEAKAMDLVDVTVDTSDTNPGRYVTLLSSEGTFCVVVNTLTGKADAKLRGEPAKFSAKAVRQ